MIKFIKEIRNKRLHGVKKMILGSQKMVGVDVGSANGLQPHWEAYEGIVNLFLFEPHKGSYETLMRRIEKNQYADMYKVLNVGLSGDGGERILYMLNSPTGSSIYPINEMHEFGSPDNLYVHPIREVKIQTQKLSDILDVMNIECIDIIKLDVQGAELEIFKGAGTKNIQNILLVELEVNIASGISKNFGPYKNAPTWTEIDSLMILNGMRLLDVSIAREYRGKRGDSDWYQRKVFRVHQNSASLSANVWEADVVYIKDWNLLIEKKDGPSLRKLSIALCGYRFFSEAYHMIELAELAGIFDINEADNLKKNILVWHNAGCFPWQRRGVFWTFFRKIIRKSGCSQFLRWKQYMWFEYPNG